jgi:hypothetical protein
MIILILGVGWLINSFFGHSGSSSGFSGSNETGRLEPLIDDDYGTTHINPASGLAMIGDGICGLDVGGNTYGSNGHDDFGGMSFDDHDIGSIGGIGFDD